MRWRSAAAATGLVLLLAGAFGAGLAVRFSGDLPVGSEGAAALSPPLKGPADAPVRIIEISEFQCPFCSRGALEIVPELLRRYPGQLAVEFWHFPLDFHKLAEPAARAAVAASLQGRFWEFHDLLFRNQRNLSPENLTALAVTAGLDPARLDWDREDSRVADFVRQNEAAVKALGLNGTPAFIVNGTLILGAQPADRFAQVIDSELAEAATLAAAGTPRTEIYRQRCQANGAVPEFLTLFIDKDFSRLPAPPEE